MDMCLTVPSRALLTHQEQLQMSANTQVKIQCRMDALMVLPSSLAG